MTIHPSLDPFERALSEDPRQAKVDQWLQDHGKNDFHECTWAEIAEAFHFAGISSPLVQYVEERE